MFQRWCVLVKCSETKGDPANQNSSNAALKKRTTARVCYFILSRFFEKNRSHPPSNA